MVITTGVVLFLFFFKIMSEKVGGAEGTKLDEEFQELERVKRKHTFRASHCILFWLMLSSDFNAESWHYKQGIDWAAG